MIPNESLSSLLLQGLWLPPDNLDNQYLLDYELGGIGLNDPSQGLRVQTWTLFLQGDDVIVEAPTYPQTILFTRSGITELSLAFDQNMNATIAFVQNDQPILWWFDTDVSDTVFTNLPATATTPRVCLDDKRETQASFSDVILAYILDDRKLYFRAQRDRFTISYLLETFDKDVRLVRVGMNEFNRLQFLLVDADRSAEGC